MVKKSVGSVTGQAGSHPAAKSERAHRTIHSPKLNKPERREFHIMEGLQWQVIADMEHVRIDVVLESDSVLKTTLLRTPVDVGPTHNRPATRALARQQRRHGTNCGRVVAARQIAEHWSRTTER